MKIVYHPDYARVYSSDPAAAPGRMESIIKDLSTGFDFVTPGPAAVDDIKLVHSDEHIRSVERMGLTYEIALLAAGGTLRAAELAMSGEPAFAVVRPPGHHASRDHAWGFCFFNNIAVSVSRLLKEGRIQSALVLDFDLHFGDGTASIFWGSAQVTYSHPEAGRHEEFVERISRFLSEQRADIIAVSAGFDRHEQDWGGLLTTSDYGTIGRLVRDFAGRVCGGRRFAALEGGYNHDVLGRNVRAFVQGMA